MNTIIGRFGDELLFVHDSEDNTIGCITQNEMGWSQDLGMQFVESPTYYGRFENFIQVNGNSFKVYNISMPRINVSVSIGVVDSSYKVVYKGMLYDMFILYVWIYAQP